MTGVNCNQKFSGLQSDGWGKGASSTMLTTFHLMEQRRIPTLRDGVCQVS